MNARQKTKPLITIDFDKVIYKNGTGFDKTFELHKHKTPRITKRLLYFINALNEYYRVRLCTKNRFLDAIWWIVNNKLDESGVQVSSKIKGGRTFHFDKL